MTDQARPIAAARCRPVWRRFHLALVLLLCLSGLPAAGRIHGSPSEAGVSTMVPGLRILASGPEGITLELRAPAPDVRTRMIEGVAYAEIAAAGYASDMQPGEPALPAVGVLLGIPPDAMPTLTVLLDEGAGMPLVAPPLPAPYLAPAGEEGDLYRPRPERHAQAGPYPASPVSLGEPETWRDQRVVRVAFHPYQVDPAAGTLRAGTRLVVRVSWAPPGAAGSAAASAYETLFENTLLNYDQARAWRIPREPGESTQLFTPGVPVYKLEVDRDGVYEVTYADLVAVDPILAGADPLSFSLSSQAQPVAIHDIGDGDHVFEPGEGFRFFGTKYRGASELDAAYTDWNVYWLATGGTPGPRMESTPADLPGTWPVMTTYTATVRAEDSHHYFARWSTTPLTPDVWFWGWHRGTSGEPYTQTYTVTLPAAAPGAYQAVLSADFVSRERAGYNLPHDASLYVNGSATPVVHHTWSGQAEQIVTATIPQSETYTPPFSLTMAVAVPAGYSSDSVFFNWFQLDYRRALVAEADRLLFTPGISGTFAYRVNNFGNRTIDVYDVTDTLNPVRLSGVGHVPYEIFLPLAQRNASARGAAAPAGAPAPDACPCDVTFEAAHGANARFAAAAFGALPAPPRITRYVPPDLAPPAGADYVFVSPPELMTATRALAAYRAGEGLSVTVITTTDIINQYNAGIVHPDAYKHLFADALANWTVAPAYALLVGDGNFNPKDYDCLTCYVPHAIETNWIQPKLMFVDGTQGQIPADEDLAMVTGGDMLPDISLGRLPAGSLAEATTVVSKIIQHDGALGDGQPWHQRWLCVADDADAGGDFPVECAEAMAVVPQPPYTTTLIAHRPPTTTAAMIANILTRTVNLTGTAFVNFRGHGAICAWDNTFLSSGLCGTIADTLANVDRYPVFVSMDCLDAYFAYPAYAGLEEYLLRMPAAGSAGSFAPTGLGYSTDHTVLHEGFIMAATTPGLNRLGLAADSARAYLLAHAPWADYLLYQFEVIGDPALRLVPGTAEGGR